MQTRSNLDNFFFTFTRCSRQFFLCIHGTQCNERHSIMFLVTIRCFQHVLFVYLGYKAFKSCFNLFHRALFCLVFFYGVGL